jgi:hypothetical protein
MVCRDDEEGTQMASWEGVTQQIFECVKAKSEKEHGTVYEPPNADEGKAVTKTAVGTVVLTFKLSGGTLTYEIVEKPWIVSASAIWEGINETIESCR